MVMCSLNVNVQRNTYQVIQGYSYICRSGLISLVNTGVHRFVYLICGKTGDTTGKICRIKGINLLPHGGPHRPTMPTQKTSLHIQYMHAYMLMHTKADTNTLILIDFLC